MFERESIRVVESSDDPDVVNFEESDLPVLHRNSGWMLSYLGADGEVREHLVTGEIDDIDLVVQQARAFLDRSPRATAWPHT